MLLETEVWGLVVADVDDDADAGACVDVVADAVVDAACWAVFWVAVPVRLADVSAVAVAEAAVEAAVEVAVAVAVLVRVWVWARVPVVVARRALLMEGVLRLAAELRCVESAPPRRICADAWLAAVRPNPAKRMIAIFFIIPVFRRSALQELCYPLF